MFRFMCFPVSVDLVTNQVKSRDNKDNARVFEAVDYAKALEQAGNHIALFEEEQMAVVRLGRVLAAEAGDSLKFSQSN